MTVPHCLLRPQSREVSATASPSLVASDQNTCTAIDPVTLDDRVSFKLHPQTCPRRLIYLLKSYMTLPLGGDGVGGMTPLREKSEYQHNPPLS